MSDDGVPEADDEFTPDIFDDTYLNMDDHPVFKRVTKRMQDEHGQPIGTANENPILLHDSMRWSILADHCGQYVCASG